MTTYRIQTINDLFKVPPEKLETCLHEIGLAVAMAGVAGVENQLQHLDWTDDGDRSVELQGPDGSPLLTLKVEGARV